MCSRFMRYGVFQKFFSPNILTCKSNHRILPSGHRKQIAHPHRVQVGRWLTWGVSGKNFRTFSSIFNFLSATANPTAVEVKLLLSDQRICGLSLDSGAHQHSATTCPWRTSMKLCIVLIFLSAISTKVRISSEDIPCASGVLRRRTDSETALFLAKIMNKNKMKARNG